MLTFGKHKGKNLSEVFQSNDRQYVWWALKNIDPASLDKQDREFYDKINKPLTYIKNKYGKDFLNPTVLNGGIAVADKEKHIIDTLKKEGLVISAEAYEHPVANAGYNIRTPFSTVTGTVCHYGKQPDEDHLLLNEIIRILRDREQNQ